MADSNSTIQQGPEDRVTGYGKIVFEPAITRDELMQMGSNWNDHGVTFRVGLSMLAMTKEELIEAVRELPDEFLKEAENLKELVKTLHAGKELIEAAEARLIVALSAAIAIEEAAA